MLTFLISGDQRRGRRAARSPDLDRRDQRAHRGAARRAHAGRDGLPRSRSIEPAEFRRLALAQPAVHRRVMQQVAPVMSRVTAIEQNRERLASLGTMAAGLAHELNNPAAAAGRAAGADGRGASTWSARRSRRFVESGIEREDAAQARRPARRGHRAARRARRRSTRSTPPTPRTRCSQRLEELGVPEPWRLAEPLAAAGIDEDWLARVAALGRARDRRRAGLGRRHAHGAQPGRRAAGGDRRMSDLVGAVKTYAYMDRGALVEVDIHEGLETTLIVLGHRLKHTVDRGRARLRPRRCRG